MYVTAQVIRKSNLIRLCTKDGNPKQSRSAVEVLHSLKIPGALESVLKKLTSPDNLRICSKQILRVLIALSTLVEKDPQVFDSVHGNRER